MIINDTQLHCHTHGSNLRMRDCIIKTKYLIDHAYNMGMKAVAVTDHASISEHIKAMQYSQQLQKEGKDIKVLLGDEIYLVDDVVDVQENYVGGETKFYHLILVAKNRKGHDQLRAINAKGWESSFMTGKLRRVPNDKKQIEEIIGEDKGNLILSTACIGGELGSRYLNGQPDKAREFLEWCIEWFTPECVAVEIQPSHRPDQIEFNKWAIQTAKEYGVRCIVTCDVHYLKPEHHDIHAAFLKSSEADRGETQDFYETTWMMNYEQKADYFSYLEEDKLIEIVNNGWDLVKDCEDYTLEHITIIPERDLSNVDCTARHIFKDWYDKYPYIGKFAHSEYLQDQYFLKMVEDGFVEKGEAYNDENIGRINWEMEQLWLISDKLGARMSAYYNLVDYIIDLCWEIGFVGISRGSVTGYYTAYLIDMQQLNPIKWNLPAYRHLNAERVSWPDVDVDTSARNRPKIIKRLQEVFGEENILNICTFKTETSKAALKTVCRGLDIQVEEAGYLSSLVPVERGKQWSLHDCFYGNEAEDRKPIHELVNEIKKLSQEYNVDLKEHALMIEGLISGLSVHASGVYIFKNGYLAQNSLMKTPRGDNVTCWEMADSDWCGGLKYDSLTTECQDKLEVCVESLIKYGKINWQGSIRSTYNTYLHPDVLNYDDQTMWDECSNGQIIDLFQFVTPVGGQCIRKIKPHNIYELANANSLMRITVDGDEQPVDKFLRYKQDRSLWDSELAEYGVTKPNELKALKEELDYCYGVPSAQEDVMQTLMRPEISKFSLADADGARKIIAKKKKDQVAGLHDKFYKAVEEQGNSINVANYLWNECIKPQLAYSFSKNHTMPYSAEALQEMNLYHFYPHVFWNCSVLNVNAGLSDTENTKSTDYGKIAKAIYRSIKFGVPVSPPSINDSDIDFTPIEETNSIFFGLGGIAGINQDIINQILTHRPYTSFKQFYQTHAYKGSLITPSKFIQLIKSGCFDDFEPNRVKVMKQYILYSSEPKTELTMANLDMAIKIGCKTPRQMLSPYNFRKYVCSSEFYYSPHPKFKSKKLYWLDDKAQRYFNKNCKDQLQENVDWFYQDDMVLIVDKSLEKLYKPVMIELKDYINTPEFIKEFNRQVMRKRYNELVPNQDVNHWSFETCSFFAKEHELAHIDRERYNIDLFDELPEEPRFVTKRWGEREWKQYELAQIAGVVLDKNDNNHLLTVLDVNNNVVQCKFDANAYSFYKQQISEPDGQGGKTVVDPSWFKRGQGLILTGVRMGENDFRVKAYKSSIYRHKVQKIVSVDNDTGEMEIQSYRYGYGDEKD